MPGAGTAPATATLASAGAVTEPTLRGRWVTLRPLRPGDMPFFYEVMSDPAVGFRWRFRGHTPSFEEFSLAMSQRVCAQFVIEDPGQQPIGLVVAYNADHRHGIVYFACMIRPDFVGRGWPLEGALLFLDYLFKLWTFRKVYAEALSFNFAWFSSWSGRVFESEGVLKDHEYYDSQYWDLHILSCTRTSWAAYRTRAVG